MDRIIELFNTPQSDLSYLDSMIIAIVLLIPLLVIISIVYFVFKDD